MCLQVRVEMNRLWRKVFEQNYHKSLDHRSFYFKQSDKKSLMPKAMLQEVSKVDARHLCCSCCRCICRSRHIMALPAGPEQC